MMAFQTSTELPDSLKDKKKMIFGYIKALHTFHDGYALLECVCMYVWCALIERMYVWCALIERMYVWCALIERMYVWCALIERMYVWCALIEHACTYVQDGI